MEKIAVPVFQPPSRMAANAKAFFLLFILYAGMQLLERKFWPRHPQMSVTETLLSSLLWAVMVIFLLQLTPSSYPSHYDLYVTDDEITAKSKRRYFPLRRRVRKGMVQTLLQFGGASTRPGIVASEHNRFQTRLWGGVFIPQDIPEYEQLRNVVESWKI